MRRYSGHSEAWGEFVDVKINAAELLRKQLEKANRGTVWISSVCDPYQPLEAKYALTRACLKELARKKFPVNIQTKSKLVLRDLDLFQEFEEIEVGFTITTGNQRISKLFEPGASPVKDRLKTLEKIRSAGIRTFAFLGPLLPGNPERLIEELEEKVDIVFIDRMNYLYSIKRFYDQLGLRRETTDRFFLEYKERLTSELKNRRMKFEVLF
jgi:DNA repair photolyase